MQGALDIGISTDTDDPKIATPFFSSSEGIPSLIWFAKWCWPEGLVKHYPGRVTSACQGLPQSQKWRLIHMASPSNADFGYSTFLWCKGPWRSTYRLTLMASVVATPILQNRDTIFFSSEGIPRLIWLAMWCWPGGLVKHHPGRVTSACQDLSKSQKWWLIQQHIEASPQKWQDFTKRDSLLAHEFLLTRC